MLFWNVLEGGGPKNNNGAAVFVSRKGVGTTTPFEGGSKNNNGAAVFVSRIFWDVVEVLCRSFTEV